ncbi:thiopurine S-methyltransferase [Flavobacterium fontis]|uniref:Thiopurine S-methyltransferase n=2 Tax=Flavobacterium fontis TaxID=1124188 RepID=A0A1M5EGL6_9FLAO|nr:thiopurine S-methyltransferase [Flavobacterium fontis]
MMLGMMKILTNKYWQERYEKGDTGWDMGAPSPPLTAYLDQVEDKNKALLIPGAGHGYELEYALSLGFTNITVLDYAEAPLQAIRNRLAQNECFRLVQSDFFDHQDSYDLILEQTFFCALSPSLRNDYVTHMHRLLKSGGKLVGLLFQFPLTESGPPFGGSATEYLERFEPLFSIQTLETCYNSIPPRQGNELFFIFNKK